ncbi:UNVERIFIED_CONTAM: hypothetical protein Sradi_0065600 [Sesamum radiatum]|uniref:Uncharacterized protein n=1 Tax=Sesamum radiatum TaxID=300843 RepID=A0AAW2WHH6_SESRA
MEALSGSAFHIQRFSDSSAFAIPHAKTTANHSFALRITPAFAKTSSLRCASRVSALAPQVPGESGDEEDARFNNDNGVLSLVSDENLSVPEGNSDLKQSSEKDVDLATPPLVVSYGSATGGGTRAGLFRTPISGGVQSATSAHGLPRPALAVRNLMEQIPGWSGLSNARVTIFGDVYPLPEDQQELNATFSKPLRELLSKEAEVDDAALISIDSRGVDIRVRQGAQFNVQRISFEEGLSVETVEEAKKALWKLLDRGREQMEVEL